MPCLRLDREFARFVMRRTKRRVNAFPYLCSPTHSASAFCSEEWIRLGKYSERIIKPKKKKLKSQLKNNEKQQKSALFTTQKRHIENTKLRIAEKIAVYHKSGALITGESLGQVASQTLPAIGVTDAVTQIPVLRPLIGSDKEEIIKISRKIDTFETSCLPYEDCCTVFTPKHPKTRPTIALCEEAEAALNIDELVKRAIEETEYTYID